MSILENAKLESTFEVKSLDDAKIICSCCKSTKSDFFVPPSFYDYSFSTNEVTELIEKYPSLPFLIFLKFKNNPDEWEKCIVEYDVINVSLCIWLYKQNFKHECILNASIKFNNKDSFDFCIKENFDMSFLSLENFIRIQKEWDCSHLITKLISESDIDFCSGVIFSYPEGYILDLIFENDNFILFSKYILIYINILFNRFFSEIVKRMFKTILENDKYIFNKNGELNSFLTNFNKFKVIFHSLILKSNLFSHSASECQITGLEVERFYPLENEKNQSFEEFLMTSKKPLLYANKYISEEKRNSFIEPVKRKIIKKLCFYNSIKCAKVFFECTYFNIRKISLKPSYDIIIKCKNQETQNMFFENIASQFCDLKIMSVESFFFKVLIENEDLKELKRRKFYNSVYYNGIMDIAIKTDNINIVKFLHNKFDNYNVYTFRNVKSLKMLKLLNSYGFFTEFSNIQNEPSKCFFYDEIPRCILIFLLKNHDNIVFDRVSNTIVDLVKVIGIKQSYHLNFRKRQNKGNILFEYDYKLFLPKCFHDEFINCEKPLKFFTEAKNNYFNEKSINNEIEPALKKQRNN